MHTLKKQHGFTLIELMIAVAVVGILSAIAIPSYNAYVQRGWRADARVTLLDNAQFMARFYSQNLTYLDKSSGTSVVPTLPRLRSPESGTVRYNLTQTAQDATAVVAAGFTITATPTGWTDATCGNLTIDQLGRKGSSVAGTSTAIISTCWTR